MHRLARELKGEIDTKMQALAQLIQLADQARDQLDASLARAQPLEHRAADFFRVEQPGKNMMHARSTAAVRATVSSAAVRSGEDLADDPRFERVYALADAGFSATKIANQIGSQIGEVELILSLRAM